MGVSYSSRYVVIPSSEFEAGHLFGGTSNSTFFCNNPMLSHEQAIMRIGRYLRHTKNRGIIFKPDKTKGLECFVDADFSGGWNQADANDAENLMSRTGYVIKYANCCCPIHWSSKLQTEIALSTAESEYIALIISVVT
jgi:hypothetical protein